MDSTPGEMRRSRSLICMTATAGAMGPAARFSLVGSAHGHDGFFADAGRLASVVA
ncbi:MAG: hypothetical protein M3Z37_07215 [Candidatus Eremiobacteraeota bacterium]|nr:hypothetical protein [Candidatus Eremiobacteraeota bacterium]